MQHPTRDREATVTPKIRYPARHFRKLRSYPVKHCEAPDCGRQLTPHYYPGGDRLESVKEFQARCTCNRQCAGRLRRRPQREDLPEALQQHLEHGRPLDPETKRLLVTALQKHDPDLLEEWETHVARSSGRSKPPSGIHA